MREAVFIAGVLVDLLGMEAWAWRGRGGFAFAIRAGYKEFACREAMIFCHDWEMEGARAPIP